MAGHDSVESHGDSPIKYCFKFDFLVTAQTRVRSISRRIFRDEVFDYIGPKLFCHIPDVERNPDDIRCPTCIARIFDSATTSSARAISLRIRRERQMHAHYVVAGLHGPGSRYRGINSTAHRRNNSHGRNYRLLT
jgi:hypothetical protein